MSIVYNRKSRRQFLIGTGNTLLALPFLPSLFGSDAKAQVAGPEIGRRLMVFSSDHNMQSDYWIQKSMATTPVGSIGAKERLLSSLNALSDVSPLLTNPIFENLRTNNLMTLIRGLDFQAGTGHGNYGGMGGCEGSCPTFDTVLEDSPSLYPSSTPSSVTKAIRIDFGGSSSIRKVGSTYQGVIPYGFDRNNYFNAVKYYTLPVMYADVFGALTNGTAVASDMTNQFKTNILNRVYQSFASFKSSRKISSRDLAYLDQHMGFLADLQRTLSVNSPAPACSKPNAPISTVDPLIHIPFYIDLLSVAFKCGLTNVGVVGFEAQDPRWLPGLNLPEGYDVHGAMHGGNSPADWVIKRNAHSSYDKYNYNESAGRFLNNLNQFEGNSGRTYIENMITAMLPRFGMEPADGGSGHGGYDSQAMLLGSMGGRLRSGRYLVYPDPNDKRMPMNAVFVTLLELMGIPASEYSRYSNAGKGWGLYGDPGVYGQNFYGKLTEILS